MHQAPGAEAPKIRTDAAAPSDATDFFGDALPTALAAEMSPSDSAATLTGPLPGAKNAHVLSNEIKAFTIQGLAVHLSLLGLLTERAIADNRTRNAAVFLEQAAKECGGIFEH